jgi:hypothetical protein
VLNFIMWNQANATVYISSLMPTGAWTHVAATLDDATGLMTLYTNAVVAAQTTTTVRPLGPLDPNYQPGVGIGNHSSQPGVFNFPFRGRIDELSVYSRALSVTELQAIYNADGAGKCTVPTPAGSCATPPSGLVSWWRAEGNALDQAGTNNGTLVGNTTYGPGRVGQAFVFDGSGDAVSLGNPTNLQLQNFTIEAWVKRSGTTRASQDPLGGGAAPFSILAGGDMLSP